MRIAILVEGSTEQAFIPALRAYLQPLLTGRMPSLDPISMGGSLPKKKKLRRIVEMLLADAKRPAGFVIALTDVYTGARDYKDAADAKRQMRAWVGDNDRFFPHAAQFEFEAWLLPYWERIQELAAHKAKAPGSSPERVNHDHPPSHHIKAVFHAGKKRQYIKVRDAQSILRGADLQIAVSACPELKALVNTILNCCGASSIT